MVLAGALASTHAWLTEFVVAERLCPWASPARASVRTVEASAATVAAEALREARALAAAPASSRAATTLVVAPAHDDATAFVRLAQSVGDDLREHGLAVDVLAFHPERVDAPLPGAAAADDDDATRHYAARSPYPTLQLLRTADLEAARAEWAERGDGMPGALGLLVENRRRLRRQTLPALAARLRGWRAVGDGTRAAAPRMMSEESGGGGMSGGRLGGRIAPPPLPPADGGGGDGGGGGAPPRHRPLRPRLWRLERRVLRVQLHDEHDGERRRGRREAESRDAAVVVDADERAGARRAERGERGRG